jgi:transcriptional regulator with XRE-family HTH domain
MKSQIRKARLLAAMTQVQLAEAVGVSQPTYQRWESGASSVPKSKVAKLAKVLGISQRQAEGRPEPFDLLGVDQEASDERKYYGELAIHFNSGSPPLLFPVTEAERSRFHDAIQGDEAFIEVRSLDNRIVFVRRKAIADAYFSSVDYDDYGPESYGEQFLGAHPDDEFWKIVEHLGCLETLGDAFSEQEIQAVCEKVVLSEVALDELIASGSIKSEDRATARERANQTTKKYVSRSRDIIWQLQGNRSRQVSLFENREAYEIFSPLSMAEEHELLYLAPEGYHRSIFICLSTLDFIAIPAHKYREGELDCAAEEVGDTK